MVSFPPFVGEIIRQGGFKAKFHHPGFSVFPGKGLGVEVVFPTPPFWFAIILIKIPIGLIPSLLIIKTQKTDGNRIKG
jgi:hypothetical protein